MTAQAPQTLRHEDIAQRIPHRADMCLLDGVSAWDDTQIFCDAISHRSTTNPLRAYGRLGASCGIEYAAQAMAIHGALVAQSKLNVVSSAAGITKSGYLVSVRGVTLHVQRLDDLSDALAIHAERVMGDAGTIVYGFTVHAGSKLLLSGRAAVILEAPLVAPAAASITRSNP